MEKVQMKNQFSVNDVLIRSNDSIYILLTIDPFIENNLIVEDNIIIEHDNSIKNIN